jgi:hypothetical protein
MGWTNADLRSFLVTVAGTVIGGLVLVIFLGLAVILAKWIRASHPDLVTWVKFGMGTFIALAVTLVGYYFRQQMTDNVARRRMMILITCAIVIGLVYVLVWVGVLAGIK